MKRIFIDMDGTIAKFNVPNALRRFATEKGFFRRLGAYKGIEHINELAKNKEQVYILSASPNMYADLDKKNWLRRYLPNLQESQIIICRNGENKAKVIERKFNTKITKDFFLLDDYTKNLTDWENAGGTGIKRITTVSDNSTGKWKGLILKQLEELYI